MSGGTAVAIFVFFAIWGACFLCGVVLLNLFLFNMDRSRIKACLKVGDFIVFVVLPPVLLLTFHDPPWVRQMLALRPDSAPAAWGILSLGCFWATALAAQILFSLRTFRPRAVAQLLVNHTRLAPFAARAEDWDILKEPPTPEDPRPGMPLPPRHQRALATVPHNSPIRKAILRWPLNRLDKSYQLQIHEIVLQFPQLPVAFDGIRVLQLSDSHYGALVSPRYHRHVLKEGAAQQADLIVITGDFTGGDYLHRESVALFASLRAPLGVWAIRGNHDYYTEAHVIAYWLEYYNIGLLTNRAVDFERNGQIFRLIGTEHPYAPVHDWASLVGEKSKETFCLALSHRPDNIVRLGRAGVDLVLAGHTHGGQWRLPLIGPLFIPSSYGRRFDQGFRQVKQGLLYTSRGFGGHTFPLRLNCPPEITVFDLRRGPAAIAPKRSD